jgi:hypothetical protein
MRRSRFVISVHGLGLRVPADRAAAFVSGFVHLVLFRLSPLNIHVMRGFLPFCRPFTFSFIRLLLGTTCCRAISSIRDSPISRNDFTNRKVSGSNSRFNRSLKCRERLFVSGHRLRVKTNDRLPTSPQPFEAFDERHPLSAMAIPACVDAEPVPEAPIRQRRTLPTDAQ